MNINRCPHCMEELGERSRGVCSFCGFDAVQNPQMPETLPRESILHGKYLIGDVLGRGGFGITYIGFDLALEMKVAIKEYYPSGAVSRRQGETSLFWNSSAVSSAGRQNAYNDFLKEARKMARIDQIPGVVRVRDTFVENETAYIIMDYVEGETMKVRLRRDGTMFYRECMTLLRPVMQMLCEVHRHGIIHRDISPDNIMIQKDGSVKLLDLGAAKDLNKKSDGMSQLVTKNGFSPAEQYMENGKIGPWTDVYALCATIYYACYGKLVPQALERLMDDTLTFDLPAKEPLPKNAVEALKKGLAVRANDRIQNVEQLLTLLGEPNAQEMNPGVLTSVKERQIIVEGVPGGKGLYTGTWKDGKPSGQGKAVLESGGVYEGGWKDGTYSGHGKYTSELLLYEGGWAEGFYSGYGRHISRHKDGTTDIYEGNFEMGSFHGQGKQTMSNGEIYEGNFKYCLRCGYGRLKRPNGVVYEGNWEHGKRNGLGKLVAANGSVYEGSFKDNCFNGYGKYTWPDGKFYEGEWVNNERNGRGKMVWPNGEAFDGIWENDKRKAENA